MVNRDNFAKFLYRKYSPKVGLAFNSLKENASLIGIIVSLFGFPLIPAVAVGWLIDSWLHVFTPDTGLIGIMRFGFFFAAVIATYIGTLWLLFEFDEYRETIKEHEQ